MLKSTINCLILFLWVTIWTPLLLWPLHCLEDSKDSPSSQPTEWDETSGKWNEMWCWELFILNIAMQHNQIHLDYTYQEIFIPGNGKQHNGKISILLLPRHTNWTASVSSASAVNKTNLSISTFRLWVQKILKFFEIKIKLFEFKAK